MSTWLSAIYSCLSLPGHLKSYDGSTIYMYLAVYTYLAVSTWLCAIYSCLGVPGYSYLRHDASTVYMYLSATIYLAVSTWMYPPGCLPSTELCP